MSAIEELKQLLDERGIEWEDYDDEEGSVWLDTDVGRVAVWPDTFGRQSCLNVNFWDYVYSPSALVNLLFGTNAERTTTRNGKKRKRYGRDVPLCECCGYAIGDARYNYCPSCGARIVK
jgi:hypothetical protein